MHGWALQDGEWNEYDAKGQPLNTGCKLHMTVLRISYPHSNPQDVCNLFHEKSEQGRAFKDSFLKAAQVMQVLIDREQLPLILPQSTIVVDRAYLVESYFELAFVTESDVVKIWGCTSKNLRLGKPQTIRLEDGTGVLHGWHINMMGMPPSIVQGLRKVKVSSYHSIKHSDQLMTPATQVRANQAEDILELALSQNLQSRATAGIYVRFLG